MLDMILSSTTGLLAVLKPFNVELAEVANLWLLLSCRCRAPSRRRPWRAVKGCEFLDFELCYMMLHYMFHYILHNMSLLFFCGMPWNIGLRLWMANAMYFSCWHQWSTGDTTKDLGTKCHGPMKSVDLHVRSQIILHLDTILTPSW